jgi:hypothetical protein
MSGWYVFAETDEAASNRHDTSLRSRALRDHASILGRASTRQETDEPIFEKGRAALRFDHGVGVFAMPAAAKRGYVELEPGVSLWRDHWRSDGYWINGPR